MSIKPINKNKFNVGRKEGEKDRFASEVSLVDISGRLTEEHLDRYEGVKSEILNTTRFDENSDLSMTYLGRSNTVRDHKMVAEVRFPISEQGYTTGKLLDSTKCQILSDTGTSKSFMSKCHYLCCKSLHSLPKFTSKTQRIQVGNGQYVSVLFIIPIIIYCRDLVYIISLLTSQLCTASRKVMIKYVGPVVIYKIIDPHNDLLMTLDRKILRGLFKCERLKPAILRTSEGNISNLSQLK